MKKFAITTALALTLITIASDADARNRFANLRPAKPTIEVNFSALNFLEPDVIVASPVPAVVATTPVRPEGKIRAVTRTKKPAVKKTTTQKPPAKKAKLPKAEPKKVAEQVVEAPKKVAPKIINTPVPQPKIISSKQPALDIPKFEEPEIIAPIEFPKIADPVAITAPEIPPAPLEFPELSEIEFPEISEPVVQETPQLAPFEQLEPFEAPELPEFPSFDATPEITAPVVPTPNEVILPPLFPDDVPAPQPTPDLTQPLELPPLSQEFSGREGDTIGIPELPTLNDNEFPPIPAPDISNIQINDAIPSIPATILNADEMNFSLIFNETATEFPLSEQGRLDDVASAISADNSKLVTISGYASGTPDQASQAKRTSLSRALSVRRHLLDNGVSSSQIIVHPLGNESGNGVPDRVDVEVSQKAGA